MPRWGRFILSVSAFAIGTVGCALEPPHRPPDVILIVVDTLRADRLGCYGYDESTSPNIDLFAGDSLLFENALSHASDTLLSCSALMSGYLPHETSIIGRLDLPQEVPMLAETLQSQGYETAAVISNYVLRAGQGFERGFEVFDSEMQQRELVRGWPERTAEYTTDRAIEILEKPRDRPLFLWVHYQDPHGPYTPPDRFVRPSTVDSPRKVPLHRSLSGRGGIPMYQRIGNHDNPEFYAARYDGEIRYVDDQFARLIATLKEEGMYEDAVIVFTADHGEGMGEHRYYFAHGESLHQGLIHIPLIVKWGDRFQGRRKDFVQHVDFVPTILGLLEFAAPESLRGTNLADGPADGRSIVSHMHAPAFEDEVRLSLVRDGLKLIYTPRYRAVELYDLITDPFEENSLAGDPSRESVVREMLIELDKIQSEDRLDFEPQDAPYVPTEEELEKLKALGYVR